MTHKDQADRFSADVDRLLTEMGLTDLETPSAEYNQLLSTARLMTTIDFSDRSQIRHALRRRLMEQREDNLVSTVEIPGFWGALRSYFSRNRFRRGHFASRSVRLSALTGALAALIIVVTFLTLWLFRWQLVEQARLWAGAWVSHSEIANPANDEQIEGLPQYPAGELQLRWQFRGNGGISVSPAVDDAGRLYAGSNAGSLYALDGVTGDVVWEFQIGDRLEAAPVEAGGVVYAGSNAGTVYAVEASTGRERWHFKTAAHIPVSPTVAGQTVFVGDSDRQIYALDRQMGRELWRVELAGVIASPPVVSGETLYVGSQDWHIYALEAGTGRHLWRFKTGDWVEAAPVMIDETLYVGSNDQNLYALEAATGQEIWRFGPGDDVMGLAMASTFIGNTIYFGSYDGKIYAVDADTGLEKWRFETGKPILSSPVVVHNLLYFGGGDGYLYGLDPQSGRLQTRFAVGSQIQVSPVAVDRGGADEGRYIYLVDGKGTLYGLENVAQREPIAGPPDLPRPPGQADGGFQFRPGGWYASPADGVIRFQGQFTTVEGQPLQGITVQADNGLIQHVSRLGVEAGWWEINLPAAKESAGWWWLTVIDNGCIEPSATTADQACQSGSFLSESVRVEIAEDTVINADWICHWGCDKFEVDLK